VEYAPALKRYSRSIEGQLAGAEDVYWTKDKFGPKPTWRSTT
jgi:hypothetical protein